MVFPIPSGYREHIFVWVFFHEYSRFTGQQEKVEAIILTLLYHFHLHLDHSQTITTESSPLHHLGSKRELLVSKRKPLTPKLHHPSKVNYASFLVNSMSLKISSTTTLTP